MTDDEPHNLPRQAADLLAACAETAPDPSLARRILALRSELIALCADASARRSSGPELTGQETQIATLAATGMTTREIAARVYLSPKTVESHLTHVYRKVGVRSKAQLAYTLR